MVLPLRKFVKESAWQFGQSAIFLEQYLSKCISLDHNLVPAKFKVSGKTFSIFLKLAVIILKICSFTLYLPPHLCAQSVLTVSSVHVNNKKISCFMKFINISDLLLTILYFKKFISFLHLLF